MSLAVILSSPRLAVATGGGTYKWESVFNQIVGSLTGPVAGGVAIAAIALFGLGLAMSEGGGVRLILGILVGLSVAASAPALASGLFGFTAGSVW